MHVTSISLYPYKVLISYKLTAIPIDVRPSLTGQSFYKSGLALSCQKFCVLFSIGVLPCSCRCGYIEFVFGGCIVFPVDTA